MRLAVIRYQCLQEIESRLLKDQQRDKECGDPHDPILRALLKEVQNALREQAINV